MIRISDQELLLAMQQLIAPLQAEIESMRSETASAISTLKAETAYVVKAEGISLKGEIIDGVNVLLENTVQSQINLIYDEIKGIREALVVPEEVDALDDRVSTLETVVKVHSQDINELKKAQ